MDWQNIFQLALHFDQNIGTAAQDYGAAIYLILFAIIFCELGMIPLFFLPGVPLLFLSGAYSALGYMNVWVLVPLLIAATILGSILNYRIGKSIGQKAFAGGYRWLDKSSLQRAHLFYENRGGMTFLISPYIAVVRTFAPFIAGAADMTFPKFVFFVSAGATLWVGLLVVGGYWLGNIPIIRDHMSAIVLTGVGLGLGSVAVTWAWQKLKPSSDHPGKGR